MLSILPKRSTHCQLCTHPTQATMSCGDHQSSQWLGLDMAVAFKEMLSCMSRLRRCLPTGAG